MTRLHQALEKAGQLERNRATLRPDVRRAEEPAVPSPQPPLRDTTSGIAEPLPLRPSTAVGLRCPKCDHEQQHPRPGPWMNRVFALMRIPLYRCGFCRHRFSGFGSDAAPVLNQLEGRAFSTVLKPADNRSFEDIIRDMARDEQAQTEPASPEEHASDGAHEREARKPEKWPAVGAIHRNHPRE